MAPSGPGSWDAGRKVPVRFPIGRLGNSAPLKRTPEAEGWGSVVPAETGCRLRPVGGSRKCYALRVQRYGEHALHSELGLRFALPPRTVKEA